MLQKSVSNLASQIVSFVISFGDRIVLVGLLIRMWGANVYSDWATLLAAASLLSVAELGFQIQYGNRLTMAKARGNSAAYARTVGVGLFFYALLAATLACVLLAMLFGCNIADLFRLRRPDNTLAAPLFGLLGITSILRVGRAGLSQIYRSQGEFHRGILIDGGITALTIGGAVASALAGTDPFLLAVVYFAAETVLGWGGMGLDITRRYPAVRLCPCLPSWSELSDWGRTLAVYALIQGLPILWLSAPAVIISVLALGGGALVSFVVQRTLVNFGRMLSNMLSVAVVIELAMLPHKHAQSQLARGVEVLARLNAALTGALAAGLVCFGPAVIGVWTGKPDLASLPILAVLILPVLATAASAPLSLLCMYAGKPHGYAIALCVQIGVGVPATWLGGLEFGIVGAASGLAIGEFVGLGIVLPLLAAGSFHIVYAPLALRCMAISGFVGLWGFATGWIIVHLLGDGSALWLAVVILVWSIVGAALPLFLMLPPTIRFKICRFGRQWC